MMGEPAAEFREMGERLRRVQIMMAGGSHWTTSRDIICGSEPSLMTEKERKQSTISRKDSVQ